jgi:RNA polymerase sigma-70 factor (ECF subfamily)
VADRRTTYEDEESILLGLRERDPSALEALYDRYARRAFGLALKVLGDVASAEDAVQEAFLTLWRQCDRLDQARGRVGALLLTVVYRRAVDLLRERRGQVPLLTDAAGEPTAGWPPQADWTMATLDREAVRRALESLPPEQRQVIEMAFFQGLTHVEVAEALGLPLGTVKSRLRLGMEKMRSLLKEGDR